MQISCTLSASAKMLFLNNFIHIVNVHILMEWLLLAIYSIWDCFHAATK